MVAVVSPTHRLRRPDRPRLGPALPVFVGLAVLGVGAILLATTRGIGTSPDSSVYATVARNIAAGDGITFFSHAGEPLPLVHYPPLYPLILWFASLPFGDPVVAARWLHAALFGGNVALAAFVAYRSTDRALAPAALAGLAVVTSVDMLEVHAMLWSEGLFLFLALVALILLVEYLERPTSTRLLAASVLAGLALFAKYPAAAVVLTGVVAIAAGRRAPAATRLRDGAVFLAISVLPTSLWIARNVLLTGDPIGRTIGPKSPGLQHVRAALVTVGQWLVPEPILRSAAEVARESTVSALVILTLFTVPAMVSLGLLVRARRGRGRGPVSGDRRRVDAPPYLPAVLLVFAAFYLGLLVASASFMDASMPFDRRKLSPILLAILPVVVAASWTWSRRLRGVRRGAALCVAVAIGLTFAVRAGAWLADSGANGRGYTSRTWQDAAILGRIRELPGGVRVYTDHPAAVSLNTDRWSALVPMRWDPVTRLPNREYERERETLRGRLADGTAVVVYFKGVETWDFVISEADLQAEFPVRRVAAEADGTMYAFDAAPVTGRDGVTAAPVALGAP